MHAIVLAGGYAKRLLPLTKDTPKPLLPVGGRPMIEYLLERLDKIEGIDKIFILSNRKFEPSFRKWAHNGGFGKKIEVVPEPSMREEDKLGAVGALGFFLREREIKDDVIVIAGDNLFDFDVGQMVDGGRNPVVGLYDMLDKEKVREKYGVVVLDGDNSIKEFHEKPANPASSLVSTGCYFFPEQSINMIHEYLSDGNNPDAPGFFISWLAKQVPVQGFVFDQRSRWFDIGSMESYRDADRIYAGKN